MTITVRDLLDRSRRELLDPSTRNRLLSIPVNSKSARIVQVYNEQSEQIFRLLVSEKKSLSFLPGRKTKIDNTKSDMVNDEDEEEVDLPQPDCVFRTKSTTVSAANVPAFRGSVPPPFLIRKRGVVFLS